MNEQKRKDVCCGIIAVTVVAGLLLVVVGTYIRSGGPMGARETARSNACMLNLTNIETAKQAWAKSCGVSNPAAPVAVSNLLPHLRNGVLPACPGRDQPYVVGALGDEPSCSLHGTRSEPTPRSALIKIRKGK